MQKAICINTVVLLLYFKLKRGYFVEEEKCGVFTRRWFVKLITMASTEFLVNEKVVPKNWKKPWFYF